MIIAKVTYLKPLEEVDRFLSAHRDFLDRCNAAGKLVASGPQAGRVGGVIMLRAADAAEADRILAEDPFRINGIASYELIDFTPTKFSSEALERELVNA